MEMITPFSSFIAVQPLQVDNVILQKRCYDLCENAANYNGIYSELDLNTDSVFFELKTKIYDSLELIHKNMEFSESYKFSICNSWINLNNNDAINSAHMHQGYVLSGVYYVKGNENNASLEFMTPIQAQPFVIKQEFINKYNEFTSNIWNIPCKEGNLVLFPSWLVHYAKNNKSSSDRISIAFNVTLENISVV
jgi:uncharacterized protein (TIGR02466 family)